MENIEIINPDDKDYYDGKLYKVGIWPGAGYQLVEFYVYASDESTALDLVVVDAEINAPNLLYSIDEVMNQITDDFQDEYVEFKNEYEDADDFTFAQEYLNYIYVDATMEGASQPYFVNGENLVIEEVQDIKEENKKEEKVKDYVFVIYRPRLTKSPIYVSGPSTETENIDEAITFDTEYDAQEYRDNLELSYKEQYKIGVKNLEENKEVKNENEEVPYDNTTEKECPKCHKKYTQFPAISRRDNKTYICPQCGVDEAIEDMLKNKKDENKEVKKENKVRFDGGYLNVVMENITEQEFWNYIQDIENTLEGETYVGEPTTVAWYDGVYQREIYSLDDTENASKFVYYSSEYNEDTNETLYTIYEFPEGPDGGKTLKKEDYDISDIVWEDFEKYSQEEINEIRDILNNLDVEAINNDGHSVAVKIKSNDMIFWIDYSLDGQDIVGDWNQYIFDTTNSDDRIRQAIQTSYYESTGDALAFDVMESAGLEYLEKNGVVVYTDEGYRFNDNLKENKKLNEKYNLKNIFDNLSKIVDYALAESFYKVFENDLDDNGNIKLSKKEIQSKLSDFIKQHKEDYQINELKQLLNSNFGLEEIKTEAIEDDTRLYELIYIIKGSLDETVAIDLGQEIVDIVKEYAKSVNISGDPNGFVKKSALTYPIQNEEEGYYFDEHFMTSEENGQKILSDVKNVEGVIKALLFDLTNSDDTELESKQESLLKETDEFPIKVKNAEIMDFNGILVEIIGFFESVEELVNQYNTVKNTNIEIVSSEDLDYTMINSDLSTSHLVLYTLKDNDKEFYILAELWGAGDETSTTLYLTTSKIDEKDINKMLLQADNMLKESKFDKISKKILDKGKQDGMTKDDADAIAASIGRKKYGKEKFQKMAQKGKKAEAEELGGEYLSNDNVDKYMSGMIYANLDMDIKGVREDDTEDVAKKKLQKQADKYNVKVISVEDSFHNYNVVLKGKLQDICDFTNGSRITIDEYINDYDLYVSKNKIQESFDDCVESCKRNQLDRNSKLNETNYTFLSPQTIGDYSNGTIEAQSVVNCKDAEDCKNKAKKFKVDVETVEPGETGYIATMKGNLQDICNFIAGKKVNMYDFMKDENTSVMLFKENKIQEDNDVKSEFKLKHLCAGCDKDMGFSDKTFCDDCEKNLSDEDKKAAIRKVMGDFTIKENKTEGKMSELDIDVQNVENDEIQLVDNDDIIAKTKDGGEFEIVLDDEADEPYYTIRYTDKNGNVKEVYGFDNVYSSENEAEQAFKDMLNNTEKYQKLVKSLTETKELNEEISSDEAKQKFIDFCKDKVKDLGTIDANDGNTYKILLTSDSYKQAQPEAYLSQDEDYLIVIDKSGEVVINSNMGTIMTDVGELDFTAIDTELYNEILDNWEDYDLADDFTYRADADIQYDKIKEMAKQLPAEIKYNTFERIGGVDVEMYVDNMPNIKASTTTMKGTEYIQDSFDIDGLWQVSTLDDNGKFNNYEYVTGWQEAVKLMQEQMPKVKKENKELQEDVNEEITLANIKQKAQEILPAEDIDTHYGDLYIKVSDKSKELINKMKDKDSGLVEIFTSEIDGQQWYDIPFANMEDDYKNKLNEAQEGTLSVELNTGVLPIVNVDMYSMGELINDYDVTQEELDEIVMELAPEYIEDTLKDILADVSIVVESVYHPSQYNFSGDELEFTLNVSRSSYESLKETTLQDDKFKSFLKQNYSSYDGFVSYMADSIDDFETQDEWKQVVQVIMFNIPENVIEYNNESYINTFIDKLSSNYPMIEDEDSLDESKKVTENKDKWMEDYEELDGMIIGYLEDHNINLTKEQQDKVLNDLAVSGILDVFGDFKSNDKIVDKTIESAIKKVTNNLDEKLLGPSDDVIADSKAKGLYTEAQEDKDLDVVNYNITDGGYKNNAETVYGILTDGTYFVYYPEMDLVETYDCEPDELIDILYASEDEMPDEARTEAYNDFFEQHNVNTYTKGPLFDKLHKLYFEDEDSLDESKKVEKKQPMSSNIEKMVSRVEALEKEYDKSNRDMTEKELCADVKKIIEEIYGVKIPDIKLTTLLQNGLGYRFKISQNINKYLKEPLDTAITLDVYFSEKTKVDSFTLDPETDLETWGLKDDDRVSFKSNNEDTKVDDSKIYVLVMNNFIYWEGTEEEFDRDDDAAYEIAIQNAIADGVEDAYDIDRSDFELMTKEELKKELKRINAIKDETKEILEKCYKKITEDVNIDDEDSLDESKKAEDEELSDTLVKLNDEMHTYLFKIYHKEIIPSEDEAIEKIKSIIKNIYNIDIPLTFTVWPNANGKPNYDGSIDKMSENLNQYLKELVDSIYLTLNIKDEKVTHIGLWIDELEFDENEIYKK